MICARCEYNEAEVGELLCEECVERSMPIAEGDLPNYKVVGDDAPACTCDDEMCENCISFQHVDVAQININLL